VAAACCRWLRPQPAEDPTPLVGVVNEISEASWAPHSTGDPTSLVEVVNEICEASLCPPPAGDPTSLAEVVNEICWLSPRGSSSPRTQGAWGRKRGALRRLLRRLVLTSGWVFLLVQSLLTQGAQAQDPAPAFEFGGPTADTVESVAPMPAPVPASGQAANSATTLGDAERDGIAKAPAAPKLPATNQPADKVVTRTKGLLALLGLVILGLAMILGVVLGGRYVRRAARHRLPPTRRDTKGWFGRPLITPPSEPEDSPEL